MLVLDLSNYDSMDDALAEVYSVVTGAVLDD